MPHDKFVTFGSWFAFNVAAELNVKEEMYGISPINEDVANAYINKSFR